jgi:HPr kinase/phosphorylase
MNDKANTDQIHATAVAIGAEGVLLIGPSGCGKSDLALRLLDEGAMLIADDRVDLRLDGDGVIASSPANIAGMLEVRGLGIVRDIAAVEARVALAVELVPREDVQRLPWEETGEFLGCRVPLARLHAFDASTPAKIRLALDMA